ncbi:hypothetical protein [Glaciimonas immobilis]|uniref:Uncharacterized protein n=1 Tax=Glaciimonas immobilis TaxID=728004 RepID=A0A840RWQ9_9BURK|nr:hypothetical protein [Glaciimonas immobilis]KAF3996632.1 hypothetical protein HAV38_18555 [Glaciimonas immobilis]MBB5200991.1 hypothetical protein [Glaciimonas immobilis]
MQDAAKRRTTGIDKLPNIIYMLAQAGAESAQCIEVISMPCFDEVTPIAVAALCCIKGSMGLSWVCHGFVTISP